MKNSREKTSVSRAIQQIADVLRRDRIAQAAIGSLSVVLIGSHLLALDVHLAISARLMVFLFIPLACAVGLGRISDATSRRFWRTLAIGFGCWWIVLAGRMAAIISGFGPLELQRLSAVAFGALSLLLIVAVAGNVHAPLAGHRRGVDVLVVWPAATILVSALTVYFVVLPAILTPSSPRLPAFLCLFISLDAYLTVHLVTSARNAGATYWRTVFTLLSVLTGAWLVSDLDNVIRALQGHNQVNRDSLLALRFVAAVTAARVGHASGRLPSGSQTGETQAELLGPRAPADTVAAAVALPIIHLVAWRIDIFLPSLRAPQEILLLVATISLGVLAWFQHRMLRQVAAAVERNIAEVDEVVQRRRIGLRLQRERERAEAAVQEVEDRFSTVFRACPSAMVITRLEDGAIVDLNESFESLTGISRHGCFGKTTIELRFWSDAAARQRFAAVIADGEEIRDRRTTFGGLTQDDREFSVDATRIELEDGPGILALVRLIDQQPRLAPQTDTANLAGIDADGLVCSWSLGMAELTGLAAGDARGRKLSEAIDVAPEVLAAGIERARAAGHYRQSLAMKQRSGGRQQLQALWLATGESAQRSELILLFEAEGGGPGDG